jgi:hypothetical protein
MVDVKKNTLVPDQLVREQDNLRQLLLNSKNSDKVKNLFDHIIEVMDFLVVNYPDEAILRFEEVSYLIKRNDPSKLK